MTVVVAEKRHHIRFFPPRGMAADKNGNPVPGTLVERDVTHPFENDLYLCSHVAIQGTARPTHYHMLMDEIKLPVEDFQRMLYEHCYQYQRATTPVSLCESILNLVHQDMLAKTLQFPRSTMLTWLLIVPLPTSIWQRVSLRGSTVRSEQAMLPSKSPMALRPNGPSFCPWRAPTVSRWVCGTFEEDDIARRIRLWHDMISFSLASDTDHACSSFFIPISALMHHIGLAHGQTMGSSLVLLAARSSSDLVLAPEKHYD